MELKLRFELRTYGLQDRCSTNWAIPAYILFMVTRRRVELLTPPWKGDVLTDWPTGPMMVSHRRFELRTTWLKVKCSANWANGPSKYIAISFTTDCAYIILQFEPLVNRFYLKKRKKLKFANGFVYSTNYYFQKL